MKIWQHITRPPLRTFALLFAIAGISALVYLVWSPGDRVRDGRHDRRTNGIWLQHGWLGDDSWFERNNRDKTLFRSGERIQELADLLSSHGMRYVFPHLCPCNLTGQIAPVDHDQTERFLDHVGDIEVIPWVGGVMNSHCFPESPRWRASFISSVTTLLNEHPRLAGVQINIEPMPSENKHFLTLLEELRQAIPAGKVISIAAYPPPTRWHPFPDVHWDESYFREVAQRVDQVAVMMYDTGIKVPKAYQQLLSAWTKEALSWSGDTQVLLGVPVYDDAGVRYHFRSVENLDNALLGIHSGLNSYKALPENYAGVAIYCEWEMDAQEWSDFQKEFEAH